MLGKNILTRLEKPPDPIVATAAVITIAFNSKQPFEVTTPYLL
jgi:hypothetical protein